VIDLLKSGRSHCRAAFWRARQRSALTGQAPAVPGLRVIT
jgi:hypothetical protein